MKIRAAIAIAYPADPGKTPKAAIAVAAYDEYSISDDPLRPAEITPVDCPDAPREVLIPWLASKAVALAAQEHPSAGAEIAMINPDGVRSMTVIRGKTVINVISAMNAYKIPEDLRYVHGEATSAASSAALASKTKEAAS